MYCAVQDSSWESAIFMASLDGSDLDPPRFAPQEKKKVNCVKDIKTLNYLEKPARM
jgi:hypothetical protein